jgi:hypothetical protein
MVQMTSKRRIQMAVVRSVMFSILASVFATVAANRLFAVAPPHQDGHGHRPVRGRSFVIVIPIVVGNSNNRIGWVSEVHHHHPRPLFGRPAR